jgi:N-acylneuraminate cytidylyltransferase/CMP-N,N'-diacetyllegionaminic acid synthase
LIAWTVAAALASSRLARTVVSTDDEHIAAVCRRWGAEVPFLRPGALAGDRSPHMDVIVHALEWLRDREGEHPDYVMLLQPTSPFRTAQDIDAAVSLALNKDADAVVSVSEAPAHPFLIKRLTAEGVLEDFVAKPEGYLPRQALPEAYYVNGAIYLAKRDVILERCAWYTERTFPYLMPAERALDIDTHWDLYLANLVMRDRNGLAPH